MREIFSLATTGDLRETTPRADSGALTLAEIQRIGQEVGIEPARIAGAAQTLEARGRVAPVRRSFGVPVGLSRIVDLPRAPTDREWEQLVSEFRTTFDGLGREATSGGLRQWTYGDIHISVEPTERGEQLRLGALKEEGVLVNAAGSVLGGIGLLSSALNAADGRPVKAMVLLGIFGGISLAAFVTNRIWLARWARKREAQMEALSERSVKLLSPPEVPRPR